MTVFRWDSSLERKQSIDTRPSNIITSSVDPPDDSLNIIPEASFPGGHREPSSSDQCLLRHHSSVPLSTSVALLTHNEAVQKGSRGSESSCKPPDESASREWTVASFEGPKITDSCPKRRAIETTSASTFSQSLQISQAHRLLFPNSDVSVPKIQQNGVAESTCPVLPQGKHRRDSPSVARSAHAQNASFWESADIVDPRTSEVTQLDPTAFTTDETFVKTDLAAHRDSVDLPICPDKEKHASLSPCGNVDLLDAQSRRSRSVASLTSSLMLLTSAWTTVEECGGNGGGSDVVSSSARITLEEPRPVVSKPFDVHSLTDAAIYDAGETTENVPSQQPCTDAEHYREYYYSELWTKFVDRDHPHNRSQFLKRVQTI
ncbi:unnamed protein product [Protopolystoma xenopodis]|uniref:Uncharacterized protein n=1 Tax=Protopolystoma xenopodis TaxID=117903 RepID=A0A448WBU5_9PLAT|nr:unnamed protein product [Protopolystoma xenopodis]